MKTISMPLKEYKEEIQYEKDVSYSEGAAAEKNTLLDFFLEVIEGTLDKRQTIRGIHIKYVDDCRINDIKKIVEYLQVKN